MAESSHVSAEGLLSLRELRPLLTTLRQPLSRKLVGDAVKSIEAELRHDLAELQQLLAQSRTDVSAKLLRGPIEEIERALGMGRAVAAVDVADAGSAADDEYEGEAAEKAQDERRKKKAEAMASAKPPAKPPAKPAPSAKPIPPKAMAEPPGGLDPHSWPIAEEEGLPEECWRSAHVPIRSIPRCPYGSKAARTLMEQRKPVILTQASLIGAAAHKWDMPFLRANLEGVPCTVYASSTRHFRYWDEERNGAGYAFPTGEHTRKLTMSFAEFAAKIEAPDAERFYLQSTLIEGVGAELMRDYERFDWEGLLSTQRKLEWGELTTNLLLVGQRGNTTPAHYDEQQNIFAQLVGTKRCLLFSPADYSALYPFPLHHPHDRQSQVDLYAPDLKRFPRFAEARPLEAVLQPGELLYIPQYWWHHIENLTDGCVSLNFWFKDTAKPQKMMLPLSAAQHLAMRRNIERLVATKLGAVKAHEAMPLLAASKPHALVADLRKEIVQLLAHVIPEAEIDDWLRELTDGRFSIPQPEGGAAPPASPKDGALV